VQVQVLACTDVQSLASDTDTGKARGEAVRGAGQLLPAAARRRPTWTAGNDVELVFLPTHGSWLNWIKSVFAALRYFALNGTDQHTHT
jgi:transposase